MSPCRAVAVDIVTGRDAGSTAAPAFPALPLELPSRSQIATPPKSTTTTIAQTHQRLFGPGLLERPNWAGLSAAGEISGRVELSNTGASLFSGSITSDCFSVTCTPQIEGTVSAGSSRPIQPHIGCAFPGKRAAASVSSAPGP